MKPEKLREVLAHNIRKVASRRSIGLNRLADIADVSRSQLFNVLAKGSSASIDWIARVAAALEVAPHELLKKAR